MIIAGARTMRQPSRHRVRALVFPTRCRAMSSRPKAIVSVCLDGTDVAYLHAAAAAAKIPFLSSLMSKPGTRYFETYGAMPSFTNPNNAGILTGGPPVLHGICGNYTYDPASGREVSTGASKPLTAPSLLALASDKNGWGTVVVTAKDKLLRMLSTGLPSPSSSPITRQISLEAVAEEARLGARAEGEGKGEGPSMSALRAAGMQPPYPTIYDPHHSTAVLEAGEALITSLLSSSPSLPGVVAYLSTTDYVQHKAGPGEGMALDTMAQFDKALGRMAAKGWAVTITADHGMNAKSDPVRGHPQVAWLSSALAQARIAGRVILPITDAHVTHHGALGGYAEIWLGKAAQDGTPVNPLFRGVSQEDVERAKDVLAELQGVREVHTAKDAARMYALPIGQVADLTVVSEQNWVLGRSPVEHDLSSVLPPTHPPLRSHGSSKDARVPLLCSWDYEEEKGGVQARLLRNWHALSAPLLVHGLLTPRDVPVYAWAPRGELGGPGHPDAWPVADELLDVRRQQYARSS